jgi:hypothetical protein
MKNHQEIPQEPVKYLQERAQAKVEGRIHRGRHSGTADAC